MKNHLTLGGLAILSTALLYSAMSPKAYDFSKWVPVKVLTSIGIPKKSIELININSDTIIHLAGAWAITILLLLSFQKWFNKSTLNCLALTILLVSLFTIIELFQLTVGRNFSLKDIAAGGIGTLIAVLCFGIFIKYVSKHTLDSA